MNQLIVTPVAGAVIGYFTNWLAIKMLFRPHTAKYLFGVKLPFTPGLMPSERHRLARKLGETLAQHIITTDMIRNDFLSDENLQAIERGLHDFLREAKAPAARAITERLGEMYGRMAEEGGGVLAYLPPNTVALAEALAYDNLPRLAGFLRDMPPELSLRLTELTGRVIDEAVGKLGAMFINRERVFGGIVNGLCEYLDDEANRAGTAAKLAAALADFLENGVRASRIPWNESFVESAASRLIDTAFDKASEELLRSETVKAGLAKALSDALSNIDLGKMAEDQMNAMDIAEAERIVTSVVNRELQAITVVGGVLGFIIGLVSAAVQML